MTGTELRWFVRLVAAWLVIASRSAIADTWQGHVATLQDARIACPDIDSDACLPYLAQAVAVADTLTDQAKYDSTRDVFEIPGGGGSIWICDPSVLSEQFNGESLLHLALAANLTIPYWDHALFISALHLCRAR
jgi:hypothetical protein